MATTTNFGWETPDDTDLVKDGAAAIRTALGGVDTSFVDLKGGTTGQVLAKASNTDLDFVWSADAAGIPATIVDAKGDLIAATAADTVARLAVGSNNQVLTADSTASTGLKWATPSGLSWTQAATGSLTGSSITVNSLSGKEYYIVFDAISASGDYTLRMRFNADTGNNYYPNGGLNNAQSYIKASTTPYGASNTYFAVYVPAADTGAQLKELQSIEYNCGGFYKSTSAITSITFYPEAGTFDNGTYYVWSRS